MGGDQNSSTLLMKLHYPKRGLNSYCGPAILSYLTGIPTHVAARHIRRHSGQRAVRSCGIHFLRLALKDFGYHTSDELNVRGLTINQWLKKYDKKRTPQRVYLVLAGRHFYLFKGQEYICGLVNKPTSIKNKSLKRRSRIYSVHEVIKHVLRYKSDSSPVFALEQ